MSAHGYVRPAVAVFLAAALTMGVADRSLAVEQTFDFEGLLSGTVVWGTQTNGDFLNFDPYPMFDLNCVANGVPSALAIFDSAHPTGYDLDLGTPNNGFGGPGVGLGGRPGMPGENKIAQKKILIIPENMVDVNRDGLLDSPDDNAHGGAITVNWAETGVMKSVTLIDIEEPGCSVDLYRGNQLVQTFPIPALGDNSQVTVLTSTNQLVDRTVVNLVGSGSIAVMVYDFGVVPTETTTWGGIKSLFQKD